MKQHIWNPWHGCRKISEGCRNCYVYFFDAQRGSEGSRIYHVQARNFYLPLSKGKYGNYKIKSGAYVYTCLTSDFFLEEADVWREEAWGIMRMRPDLVFVIITKRINRVLACLPKDWGIGWENVYLHATVENQRRADERIPILLRLPFRRKGVVVAPFIESVSLSEYLVTGGIERVVCSGENYKNARPLYYDWVYNLSLECRANDVTFSFFETGCNFIKNGRKITTSNKLEQAHLAHSLGLDYQSKRTSTLCLPKELNYVQESLFESDRFL